MHGRVAILAGVILLWTGCAQARPDFRTAGDLLDALERADEGLTRLTAQVLYDKTFEIAGDRQRRLGDLSFVSAPSEGGPARRKFAMTFSKLWIGERVEEEVKVFVFDGEWLVEKTPAEKMFIKRQVVAPGENFDPLRIGEGPLPIPIGQKRADIDARFDSELLPPESGLIPEKADDEERAEGARLTEFARGSYQIKLTPKPGGEAESDFREIRLWYKPADSGRLLPLMARTINTNEDVSIVQLINVKTNDEARVDQKALETTTPAEGWEVRIEPWREPVKRPAAK